MANTDDQATNEGTGPAPESSPPDLESLEARIEKLEQRSGCVWAFMWVLIGLWVLGFIVRCADVL